MLLISRFQKDSIPLNNIFAWAVHHHSSVTKPLPVNIINCIFVISRKVIYCEGGWALLINNGCSCMIYGDIIYPISLAEGVSWIWSNVKIGRTEKSYRGKLPQSMAGNQKNKCLPHNNIIDSRISDEQSKQHLLYLEINLFCYNK